MKTVTAKFAVASAFVGFLLATTAGAASPLPQPFETRNGPVTWTATAADALTITAGAKTDWFVAPWDFAVSDNAPTLLVHPKGNFSLSAKVRLTPLKRADAGALVLYLDNDRWAKLCVENDHDDGKLSVVMVVNQGVSDDSYTTLVAPDNTLYLQVARNGTGLFFHVSQDGKNWTMVRTFTFKNADLGQIRAGLLAQSPFGDGMAVDFSEIRYNTSP